MLLSLIFQVHYIMFDPKKHNFIQSNEKKIITLTAVILTAVYISLVWNNNVWMDEAFTASLVHTDFAGVISRSMADTLPPLYNILLKLATFIFGYSIPVMKLTSVIPMILTLIIGATVVRRRFGFKTAVLFMLYITFMPIFFYFGVEIRMYSLGFFFATASGIYAYEVVKEPSRKNWVAFTLYSVLAGYSHHFAFVTVAFSYLYILLYYVFCKRDKIAEWFKCLLATFVLYLPCLLVTLTQIKRVSGYFSMPDMDLKMIIHCAEYPYIVGFLPATLVCFLMMATAVALIIADIVVKKRKDDAKIYALCCFSVFYGVLIFGTIVSRIMTANIFVDRYLFFATGLLWLCAAVVLPENDRMFYTALIVTAFIAVFTYSGALRTEYGNSATEEIEFLRENVNEGDVLACIGGHEEMENCIPFYTYVDKDTAELEFVYPLEEAVKVSKERGSTLWIAVLDGFSMSDEDMDILQNGGLTPDKAADFEFDRYRCELYRAEK